MNRWRGWLAAGVLSSLMLGLLLALVIAGRASAPVATAQRPAGQARPKSPYEALHVISSDPLYPEQSQAGAEPAANGPLVRDEAAALAIAAAGARFPDRAVMGSPIRIVMTGDPQVRARSGFRAVYGNQVEFDMEPRASLDLFEDGLVTGTVPADLPAMAPPFKDGRRQIYEQALINGRSVLIRRAGVQLLGDGQEFPVPPAVGWREGNIGYWLQCRPGAPVTLEQLMGVAERVIR